MIEGQNGRNFARTSLVKHLDQCVGRTLGELDVTHFLDRVKSGHKGVAGDLIEYSVLLLPSDHHSEQEPDIEIDGKRYEVKTTGIEVTPKGEVRAKEPVSITKVKPENIVYEEFRTSKFWDKVEHLLFFYYFYDAPKGVPTARYASFRLLTYQFHEYHDLPKEEQIAIEKDWWTIHDFIVFLHEEYTDYKAEYSRISHETREKLMLLDLAPRKVPRFRFKRSFVTTIYLRHQGGGENPKELLPRKYVCIQDVLDECANIVTRYRGKTVKWLCNHFGVSLKKDSTSISKSITEPIIVKLFGGTRKEMKDIDLFSKVGIVGKSIVLTKTGGRTEDAKFFTIDFDEFADESMSFEDSQFYEFFSTHKILFIIFEEPSQEASLLENKFIGFSLITLDEDFIQTKVRPIWERVRRLVLKKELVDVPVCYKRGPNRGKQIVNKNGELRSTPNFPKAAEGDVFVRGTGTDSRDKREIVNGIRMYYQQVWIRGEYLSRLVAQSPQIK